MKTEYSIIVHKRAESDLTFRMCFVSRDFLPVLYHIGSSFSTVLPNLPEFEKTC